MKIEYPVGIIDIGSHSVRLMYDDGIMKDKTLFTTRLGEGLSFSSFLKEEAISRTVNGIVDAYNLAKKRECKSIYAFATAACRNSQNGYLLVDKVKELIGLDIDVVSSDLEGKLALMGVLNGKDGGVIDVGGASSEIVYSKNGEIIYNHSLKEGAVKINDRFSRDKDKIDTYMANIVEEYGQTVIGNYYAVGGTVTSLAAISLNLKEYDPKKVHLFELKRDSLLKIKDYLYTLTPSEILERYAVSKTRSEIIAGGASIYLAIMDKLNVSSIIVSEDDNLEGYLLYLKNKD